MGLVRREAKVDVPLVAATPVQDLRFRANNLRADAKSTARWLRTTAMAARPGELRQAAIHSPATGASSHVPTAIVHFNASSHPEAHSAPLVLARRETPAVAGDQ
jgi:hypothetical protein